MKMFYQKVKNTNRLLFYFVSLIFSVIISFVNKDFSMLNYWFFFFSMDSLMFIFFSEKEENK